MINVILIDDDKDYAESLIDAAYLIGIEVTHNRGLEEGIAMIKDNLNKFHGLILDGRGWLSEDRPRSTSSHVHAAIREIIELRQQGIYLPYVINTGFFDQLSEQIEDLNPEIVFDKTHGMEPMFEKLLSLIEASPVEKIKAKYPEPLLAFGGNYLPEPAVNKLLSLLTWMDEGVLQQNYFNTIRDLLEEMLKRANAIDSTNFLPSVLLNPAQNGRPNLKACELYLTGREVDLSRYGGKGIIQARQSIFSPHIGWLFSAVSNNSQILSHNYTFNSTSYAFRSSVFALIEVLIWFKDYVDQNYPRIN